jgi:hypothetical protein
LKDPLFSASQKDDAFDLADKGTGDSKETFKPDWDHGVILVTGDCFNTVDRKLKEVKATLSAKGKSSIAEVATLAGNVRPGENKGHEQ